MAVDANATRRQRAWDSIRDGASRTWSRSFRGSAYVLTLANPQIRTLNGGLVFSVDMTVTKDGAPFFDDRVNMPNPPLGVYRANGTVQDNPLQALRDTLIDVLRSTTADLTTAHLMRGPDGQFTGDTLAVRSSTADGRVTSSGSSTWNTVRDGNSLSSTSAGNPENISCTWDGIQYTIRQLFLDFDTSSLGAGATLSNAVFTLYGNTTAETSTDGYDLQIRPKNWGGTVTTADYVDCNPGTNWTGLTLMAHLAVSSWNQSAGAANNFTVDSYADVSKTGTTYVVVGMSGFGSSTAPTGVNDVECRTANQSGTTSDPLLTVTYTPGGTAFTQSLGGTVTPAGAISKKVTSSKGGTVTSAGTVANKATKALGGTVTAAGAIVQKVTKLIEGTVTPAGNLLFGARTQSLGGTVTPVGELTNKVSKTLEATVTSAGALLNAVRKALGGTVPPSGDATNVRTQRLSLDGTVTAAGAVTHLVRKTLEATVTSAGAVTKFVAKSLAGTVTPEGALAQKASKLLGGAVTPAGGLTFRRAITLGGTVTPAGVLSYIRREGSIIWAVARDIPGIFASARELPSIAVVAYDLEAVTGEAADQASIAATAYDVEQIIGEALDG